METVAFVVNHFHKDSVKESDNKFAPIHVFCVTYLVLREIREQTGYANGNANCQTRRATEKERPLTMHQLRK